MTENVPLVIVKAIDELLLIKDELKILKAKEKERSSFIKKYMVKNKLKVVNGKKAQAVYSTRAANEIDPKAYFELLGGDLKKFLSSVIARTDPTEDRAGARSYLGKDALESICRAISIPVLHIKRLISSQAEETAPIVPKHTKKIFNQLPFPKGKACN